MEAVQSDIPQLNLIDLQEQPGRLTPESARALLHDNSILFSVTDYSREREGGGGAHSVIR